MILRCHACNKALSKRRAFKLEQNIYCPSDYFQALKEMKEKRPDRFQKEIQKIEKIKSVCGENFT